MNLGLCKGRHEIAGVTEYVFPQEVDPLDVDGLLAQASSAIHGADFVNLYVTGLTVALVAVINACAIQQIPLTLWHYDRESGEYYPQSVEVCGNIFVD